MVYNEMFTSMPNNGFGSPTSPPDVFQEVPSPSQYSGPPSTPPSMHSPPHYTTTISPSSDSEKFESFIMKEEPMSPYSGGYSSGTLIAGQPKPFYKQQVDEEFNMQLSSLSGHCQQQQYLQQQQPPYYHQHQQQKELEQMKLHQQQFQQQVDVCSTHQQHKTLQGTQGKPDFVVQQNHSSDEASTNMTDADLPMWCLKVLESFVTPDSDGQQQSETNRQFSGIQQHQQPQQHGYFHAKGNSQDQQLAESGQLPNLEVFTAISPNSTSLGGQNQGETSPVPIQTNVGTNSPSCIQSENDSDIKIEDNSGFQFAAANAVDTIVQNGITEAGISHNPSEWSAADVKLWFKKCSEGYGLGVFEINPTIQIDGEMLLTMSSTQFGEAIGLKEGELLRDCLSFWIARRTSQNSESYAPMMEPTVANKQIKLENLDTQELLQVKQEIVSHSLLPVSVVCANQAQNVSSTMEQSVCLSSFNNNSGNQSLPGHLQQSPSTQVMQHGSHTLHGQKRFQNYQQQQNASLQLYQTSQSMQQHQHGQQQQFTQQQQCFTQRSVPPQNPNLLTVPNQQQGTTNQSRMGSPMHGMTASPAPSPGSPAEAQMSSMMVQPAMPSSTNSHPVPLQEGINGYIDESDADLSLLLQQATVTNSVQQHPATLDQDDLMDTDDESDEDPPSSVASKGGRGNSSGRTHIQLWQFLKELLNNNKRYGSCIRWIDRQEAIFKIEDSVKVATLWGERKNRPHMNYDKLSRSIRQYYNKNIMKKTARSQRLVYQFVRPYGD